MGGAGYDVDGLLQHPIEEFTAGGEDICIRAVAAVLAGLGSSAASETQCVASGGTNAGGGPVQPLPAAEEPTAEPASEESVAAAAAAVGSGPCVYLHCRAGHGRTGLVAAVVLGFAYPAMPVGRVMDFVQQAHDSRRDSWNEWSSPETEPQVQFARELIMKLRSGAVPPQLAGHLTSAGTKLLSIVRAAHAATPSSAASAAGARRAR